MEPHVPTIRFGITNNAKGSSVFYATTRVLKFGFAEDMGPSAFRQSFQIYLMQVKKRFA
jgi:hypothetical protein